MKKRLTDYEYYKTDNITLYKGWCIDVMKNLEGNSIDTIISDVPYGISFMNKKWDYDIPSVETFREMLRVLKPGGTALIFAGSRTQHRMGCNIEDAGFLLKDCIMYIYGSGFPKATDIKKNLEKKYGKQNTKYNLRFMSEPNLSQTEYIKNKQGQILFKGMQKQGLSVSGKTTENDGRKKSCMEGWGDIQTSERELQRCKICTLSEKVFRDGKEGWICNGTPFDYGTKNWADIAENRSCSSYRPQPSKQQKKQSNVVSNKPNPQEIRSWDGWKSHGLKPAYEPIIIAMKPNEGSYAENALKHEVSGLNIDGGRIGTETIKVSGKGSYKEWQKTVKGFTKNKEGINTEHQGRFPANIILDEESGAMLDEQVGELKSGDNCIRRKEGRFLEHGGLGKAGDLQITYGDKGGPSRFFYCAKASKSERNAGCENLEEKELGHNRFDKCKKCGGYIFQNPDRKSACKCDNPERQNNTVKGNHHPTVKPLSLMEYLCKLTKTPTGGIVLDPYMGSGTTGIACNNTGRQFIGIEKEGEYCEIAKCRIGAGNKQMELF